MRRLSLALQFGEDLIVVNKPAGFSTHAVDPDRPGLAELVEKELLAQGMSKKLYVVHRLDKTTTGVLLFATSENRARELFECFKQNKVKKRYTLITASQTSEREFSVHSRIEKKGKTLANTPCAEKEANASTHFRLVKLNALFQQWEAFPQSGKTHQIRLHAAQAGIPILGDRVYGGADYPHLCLHAESLEIPGVGQWNSFHPIFFERMGLLRDRFLAGILSACDRRQRLYDFLNQPELCFRLSHLENPHFRIDAFGPVLWVYWYSEIDPTDKELAAFEFLQTLLKKKVLIQKMLDRGKDPLSKKQWSFAEIPEVWTAKENDLLYEFRKNQGLSPGLFLDQRENRHWLSKNVSGKRVLNLFSYTCGFSLSAILGSAKEVISVDLSKNFLEWGKQNLKLNASGEKFALFFAQDSEEFLKQTLKKGKGFDFIVLDPPSFSRGPKGLWKFEKDFPELLRLSFQILNPGGKMLCSSNFEKWDFKQFRNCAEKTLGKSLKSLQIPDVRGLDFEVPGEPPLMKSMILEKEGKSQ